MSFVFYDTETTGTDTAFDQILQFGAIKTDAELNEIDRFEIRCRLLSYIVPSPGAMRVTGVTAEQLIDPSLPSHYEMIRDIRAKLTDWSPAIFIGHNSLRFDEPLLREALYKTLHGPYLTNTNGNGRTDTLPMLRAVSFLAPNALTIPLDDKGKQIFKLDRLAPANGLDHMAAHDAMGDVEATIHMARLIAERVPNHWDRFIRFAQKPSVLNFIAETDVFALSEFYYNTPYSWMVTRIGFNPDNGSEVLVFDLANDPADFLGMNDVDLVSRLSQRPRPVRSLRSNAAPIIVPYDQMPEELRAAMPAFHELQRRAEFLKGNKGLRDRLIAAVLGAREPREPSAYVEEQIYDGFPSNSDSAIMERFHETDWRDRKGLLDRLADERLRHLGQRLIYTEAPDTMDAHARHDYDVAIARRLLATDDSLPWLTYPKAIAEVEKLLAAAQGAEKTLISGHYSYLREHAARAAALLEESDD